MSRLVLALDTATEVTAVAVGRLGVSGLEVLASCDSEAPRAAMSRLLPCVEDLLGALGLAPTDLDEVVVGTGPGSFTGVRIGVATAKGMAHGLSAPLYGVGTLDAIAWRLAHDEIVDQRGGEVLVGVVGDAMRGEVYPARFRVSKGRAERIEADTVAKPDAAVARWAAADRPLLLAGNGLRKYCDSFVAGLGSLAALAPEGLWSPSGVGLLAAYEAACESGMAGSGDPGALLPAYTRLSDAEEAERDRACGAPQVAGGSRTPSTGVRGPLPRGSASASDGGGGDDS